MHRLSLRHTPACSPAKTSSASIEDAFKAARRCDDKELTRLFKSDSNIVYGRNALGQTLLHMPRPSGLHESASALAVVRLIIAKAPTLLNEFEEDPVITKCNTPLIHACRNCYMWDAALYLLQMGANPNLCNTERSTALHYVVREPSEDEENADRHVTLVRELLNKGPAVINLPDKQGMTPLHISVRRNNVDYAHALLAAGANLDIVDMAGNTPVHYMAARSEFNQLLASILQPTPPVDAISALFRQVELLENHQQARVRDKSGHGPTASAYVLARNCNNTEAVDMLTHAMHAHLMKKFAGLLRRAEGMGHSIDEWFYTQLPTDATPAAAHSPPLSPTASLRTTTSGRSGSLCTDTDDTNEELSSFFDQFISTLSDVNSETRTCGASNCRVRLRKWVMDLARLAPEPETQALIRNYITDRAYDLIFAKYRALNVTRDTLLSAKVAGLANDPQLWNKLEAPEKFRDLNYSVAVEQLQQCFKARTVTLKLKKFRASMEAMGREMVVIDPGHGGDERTPVRLYCFVRAKIGDAYAVLSFLEDYCDSELDGDESPGLMITFEGVLEILKHGDPSTLRDIKIIKDSFNDMMILLRECTCETTQYLRFLADLVLFLSQGTPHHEPHKMQRKGLSASCFKIISEVFRGWGIHLDDATTDSLVETEEIHVACKEGCTPNSAFQVLWKDLEAFC